MAEQQIRFEDGAAYERHMGGWSRLAGEVFLDWLAPSPGWRWIDIGCGGGAFSQLLVDRCEPAAVNGIDPSEAQLAYARTRPAARLAQFQQGDAMALPFPDGHFDAAVMALVIFFVPTPARGVAEMRRTVRPGGAVATYAWDIVGNGIPYEPILAELRTLGVEYPLPPSAPVSRLEALDEVWRGAGLDSVATRVITVSQTYTDFDDYWTTHQQVPMLSNVFPGMSAGDIERLKERVQTRLSADAVGPVTVIGRANAIKGRVPA